MCYLLQNRNTKKLNVCCGNILFDEKKHECIKSESSLSTNLTQSNWYYLLNTNISLKRSCLQCVHAHVFMVHWLLIFSIPSIFSIHNVWINTWWNSLLEPVQYTCNYALSKYSAASCCSLLSTVRCWIM